MDAKKPLFDVNDEADKSEINPVRNVQEKFTTFKRLKQIWYVFSTELNESIHMRITKLAPKWKCFSRSRSLDYRISHVTSIHNLGIHEFLRRVLRNLNVPATKVLLRWTAKKQVSQDNKKKWDKNPDNKRKRAHKQKEKVKEQIYEERAIDIKYGTYELGVSCTPEQPASNTKLKHKRKQCPCGAGEDHYTSSYSLCCQNKNNQKK